MDASDTDKKLGRPVPGFHGARRPPREPMAGRFCRLVPLDPEAHADQLFSNYSLDKTGENWTYLPYGPFPQKPDFSAWLQSMAAGPDPRFYAVVTEPHGACGLASYLRINPELATIEVGHIHFSPVLQRRPASTEAMHLMMAHAFGLGYRRYEWKCNALNTASRRAAERLGFTFEGIFRQAAVYKGRNRDTAWFSIIDSEWPLIDEGFRAWLAPANFDDQGRQLSPLDSLRPKGGA